MVENGPRHYSTGHSSQPPNGMLSESQLLDRFFLDHKERAASLFSADAAEDPNSPLVSTGSSVGPNGQNDCSSVGASTAVNETG